MCNIPYQEAIGSLMYASLGTHLDITCAVQALSRFSTKPGTTHWEAIKQVFHYLKGTKSLWLYSLLSQLSEINSEPITLFSDNQSAIALTKDHQYHACTKHINIHFHFIHWIVKNKSLQLSYCPTNKMVANMLIKALLSPKVKHFAAELGLVSI